MGKIGNLKNRKVAKLENRKIGNSEYRKYRKSENWIFGNRKIGRYSDIRKIGNLDYRKFGKSENTSLARAVASLARTGNTCKYFGTLKSGSPEVHYFGSLVNRKFGNSKHRKIGGSEKRKFRKSKVRKKGYPKGISVLLVCR